MSQTSLSSYFPNRKRAAADELSSIRNKVLILDQPSDLIELLKSQSELCDDELKANTVDQTRVVKKLKFENLISSTQLDSNEASSPQLVKEKKMVLQSGPTQRTTRSSKRITSSKIKPVEASQPKIVQFVKMGNLSPKKKMMTTPKKEAAPISMFASKESLSNVERGMKTPTKQITPSNSFMDRLNCVSKNLTSEDIKNKISKNSRLDELKEALLKVKEAERKLQKSTENTKNLPGVSLKQFKTIELEVLSPRKEVSSPRKLPTTPQKDVLMSPRKTTKTLLFSPIKDYSSKILLDGARIAQLILPFEYRVLSEMFKCCESICAMFHNRRESITFKKLKPAVQRLLRKNFTEQNLAQIKEVFPDAYNFSQVKMRNFGSTSKQDHYQLVIAPNVAENIAYAATTKDENLIKAAQNLIMNPQIIIDRQRKFDKSLLNLVHGEHEKFLSSLEPPINIPRENVKNWHANFHLEKCSSIKKAEMPIPPNIEKFSSAKDVLATARNLFNCGTPLEKAMERLEAKKNEGEKERAEMTELQGGNKSNDALFKGISKSLLEKIREKQAAKALAAMTRRPSQDVEAIKFGRLPELARHLRNVFVTERKGVLPLENVLKKLENSFRINLTLKALEDHLKMLSTEIPNYLTFHEIRKVIYVKVNRDIDLTAVITKLEKIAAEKAN